MSLCPQLAKAKISMSSRPRKILTPKIVKQCLRVTSLPELYILAIGIMREASPTPANHLKITQLQRLYLTLDFDALKLNLKAVFSNPTHYFTTAELATWQSCISKCNSLLNGEQSISKISENQERRYFESVFAQRYLTETPQAKWIAEKLATENLSKFFCEDVYKEPRAQGWDTDLEWHSNRERNVFENYLKGKLSESSPTLWYDAPRSPGIFKSVTRRPFYLYTFPDSECSTSASKSDKNKAYYDLYNDVGYCYPKIWVLENLNSPFVSSYSGHALESINWLLSHIDDIAAAEKQVYMIRYLESYLCAQISQGYHSYQEIMVGYLHPIIIKDLKAKGLKLDKDMFFSCLDNLIADCFADMLFYTTNSMIMRCVLDELREDCAASESVVNEDTLAMYELHRSTIKTHKKAMRKTNKMEIAYDLLKAPNLFRSANWNMGKGYEDPFVTIIKTACLLKDFEHFDPQKDSKIITCAAASATRVIKSYARKNKINIAQVTKALKAVKDCKGREQEIAHAIERIRELLLRSKVYIPYIRATR